MKKVPSITKKTLKVQKISKTSETASVIPTVISYVPIPEIPNLKQNILTNNIKVEIKPDSPQFIPMYKTKGAAAADLIANIPANEAGERVVRLIPGHIETIDVGFSMALPEGWEAQIRPRSGLARKGVQVTNSPGTIDDDYRDRLQVILNNAGREIVVIKHGDRFAQIALKPVWKFQWNIVNDLTKTDSDRVGGLGSTGV